jgi:hypothetical protein
VQLEHRAHRSFRDRRVHFVRQPAVRAVAGRRHRLRGRGLALSGQSVTVTVTVTDKAGNTDSDFVVQAFADATNPAMVAPPSLFGANGPSTDAGICTASGVNLELLGSASASDNCGTSADDLQQRSGDVRARFAHRDVDGDRLQRSYAHGHPGSDGSRS